MSVVVVIQARTNSSRLPGKVLLPLGGLPLVVLAAKRAANTGLETMVITSSERSDDALAECLKAHGVTTARGSLDNTLNRFVTSLNSYDDEKLIVRLTADNVCPDGTLIQEVIDDFIDKRLNYIFCNGEESGLPYGMSLEITKLKLLKEADCQATSMFEREHVTPYIINKYGKQAFDKYKNLKLGKLNCTVDNLDDYLQLCNVFTKISDPINVSFLDLNTILYQQQEVKVSSFPKKFVLGTAQLGLNYGITNVEGKPSLEKSIKLLTLALRSKVPYIDTASAYGNSEAIVGQFMSLGFQNRSKVITKIFFTEMELKSSSLKELVVSKVYHSLIQLKTSCIDTLLLHRADYLYIRGSVIWETLKELKQKGLISILGVSVQTPDEATICLENKEVEHIQMPFNILDWRWDIVIEGIKVTRSNRKLIIHCRSAFLQGLLLSSDDLLWGKAHVKDAKNILNFFDFLVSELNYPLEELLLSYVTGQNWVDGVVVGVENHQQLIDNLNSVAFSDTNINFENTVQSRPVLSENSLTPSTWDT